MRTLLITQRPDGTYVVCRQSRTAERLRARIHRWRLDTAIAGGACPDSAPALSLRANELIGRRSRGRLSRAIQRLLRRSNRSLHPIHDPVPICWQKVRSARPALEQLAAHLSGPDPVDARGVAMVQIILSDGSGPLFSRPCADDLEPALEAAIEALEPRFEL